MRSGARAGCVVGLEDKAVRGVPWTLLSYAVNKAITLATTVVLARLLAPDDFGIVVLGYVAITALTLYGDAGVAWSMIVRQPLEHADQRTSFTLILALRVGSAGLLALASPLIASAIGEPDADGVIAALAGTLVFAAPATFYEAVMQRELEFRHRFVAMSVQNLVYAPTAITLAALGADEWSLVAGYLAGGAASAVAYVALAPYRVWPGFAARRAWVALASGVGYMFQGALAFLRENVDYLVVGRVLGAAPLGAYALAYRLADVPYRAIAEPVARVTFPGFARMSDRDDDVGRSFLSVLRLVALVTCPIGVVLSGAADPFVRAVLGEAWLGAIGPLGALGVWAAVRSTTATAGWLLNSLGHAGTLAKVSAAILLPLVPGVVLAAELGGTTTVALVVLGDTVIELLVLSVVIARRLGVTAARQWVALRWVALASVPAWVAARLVAEASEGLAPGLSLVCSIGAGLALYTATLAVLDPGALRHALRQGARTLRRAPAVGAG